MAWQTTSLRCAASKQRGTKPDDVQISGWLPPGLCLLILLIILLLLLLQALDEDL